LGAPASPIDLGTTGSLFQTDVTLSPRKVLFGASTVRFDAVLGLYDGSRGGAPQALGELALDPAFGGDTTGVAADDRFLYVTGTRGAATLGKPGYLGQTRMFIARYADFTDGAGIAPTVSFESPADGGSATAGRPLQVVVRALDDVGVAEVRLLRTGHPAEVDPIPPYAFTITPTEAGTEIALDAVAVDFAGHQAAAPTVRVAVVADPAPLVEILHPAAGDTLREGQFNQSFQALATDDSAVRHIDLKLNGVLVAASNDGSAEVRFDVPLDVPAMVFEAIATDDAGQVTTAVRTIPVQADPPPVVTILAPAAGSSVVAGTVMPIRFTVSDDDPFLRLVELFVN